MSPLKQLANWSKPPMLASECGIGPGGVPDEPATGRWLASARRRDCCVVFAAAETANYERG